MTKPPLDKEVFDLLNQTRLIKPDYGPAIRTALVFITVLVGSAISWIAYANINSPKGAFTSPVNGSYTDRLVELEGYTKSIPPDRKYF